MFKLLAYNVCCGQGDFLCSREQALFCIAFNLNPVVVSRNQVGDYFVITKIIRVVNVLVVYTTQFNPAAAIPILKCQFCEAEFFDVVGGFKVDSNAGSIWTVTAESYVVPCEQIGGLRINAFVKKNRSVSCGVADATPVGIDRVSGAVSFAAKALPAKILQSNRIAARNRGMSFFIVISPFILLTMIVRFAPSFRLKHLRSECRNQSRC